MPIKPPECKTCGKAEWRHLCSGPPPTLQEIRDATAALERAFPSHPNPTPVSRKSPAPGKLPAVAAPLAAPPAVAPRSSSGRTAAFDAANVGSMPARGTKLAELEALAAEASARIAAKPRKGKRVTEPKKPSRGRPVGDKPFDKKAHDRQKAAERRAAAKAKVKP